MKIKLAKEDWVLSAAFLILIAGLFFVPKLEKHSKNIAMVPNSANCVAQFVVGIQDFKIEVQEPYKPPAVASCKVFTRSPKKDWKEHLCIGKVFLNYPYTIDGTK